MCIREYHHLEVDEYWPSRLGGDQPHASWHDALNPTSTLCDALDAAHASLFNKPDGMERADAIDALEKDALLAHGIFEAQLPADLKEKSANCKCDLARTRTEQMLARLFLPDAMEKFDAQQRDEKVRTLKKQCSRYAKWATIFGPLYRRALDAMKLK